MLQLPSTLLEHDESGGLNPLYTHVKGLIWKAGRIFFSPSSFSILRKLKSLDEIQWILQRRNLIADEWIFV